MDKQHSIKKIYAIVVTYNGMRWITQCVSSLRSSNYPLDIIVVDNNSGDNTVDIIKDEFPDIKLIRSDKNLGFGQANNIGLKYAYENAADYFFLLNQDAWVEEHTIRELVGVHQNYNGFGCLVPVQLEKNKSRIDYNFLYYMYKTENILSDIYLGEEKAVYSTEFANAAAWLISRECVSRVGLFDPFFFHYSEDRNFCHRVKYHGFNIGICPRVTIVHDRGERKKEIDKNEIRKADFREEVTNLLDIRKDDFYNGFKADVSLKKRNMVKGVIKLDFKRFRQNFYEYRYLKNKEAEMRESFERNRIGGSTYLEVK